MKTINTHYVWLLWIALYLAIPQLLPAQTKSPQLCTVKGQIVDKKTGESIPYVTVGFGFEPAFYLSQRYAIADENGYFSYQLPQGRYGLIVSCVGYREYVEYPVILDKPGTVLDIGKQPLTESPVTLDEVTVRPLVTATSSEIVYNLAQDPDRETMNLQEILDKIPMIDRTPDGKLYIENPNMSFLIVRNGKEDALFSSPELLDQTLQALPAKAFQKATLKLMPETRYGNHKYVLSIDADEVNQLFGVINQNHDSYEAHKGQLRVMSGLLSSHNRLRMAVSGDFLNTNSPKTRQLLEQHFHEDGSQLTQNGRTYRNGERFGGGGTFSYDLGTQQFITAQINYSNTRSRQYNDLAIQKRSANGETAYNTWSQTRNVGYSLHGYINYQYDFANPQQVLNVVYNFTHSPGKQDNRFDFEGEYDPDLEPPLLRGDSHNEQHTLQVHYSNPVSQRVSLESGAGYVFRDYHTTSRNFDKEGEASIRAAQDYDMQSKKHLWNAYLNLRYQSKFVSGHLNLKAEYLDDGHGTVVHKGTETPQYISQTGFTLTPNAQISFMLKDKWISRIGISYQWMKQRPNIHMMTTQTDYSNPNYLFAGNPELDDEDRHHLGVNIGLDKGPSILLFAQYSGNDISPYWYTDPQGRVIHTYANDGIYKSIGFTTMYMFTLKNFMISTMWSENYNYTRTADGQRTEQLQSNVSVQTSLGIGKHGSVNLTAYYTDFHTSGMNSMKLQPFSIRLSTRWNLFKNHLEAEAGLADITRFRSKQEQEQRTGTFDQHLISRTNTASFYIKLNWRIGSFQVKPVRKARRGAIIDDIIQENN